MKGPTLQVLAAVCQAGDVELAAHLAALGRDVALACHDDAGAYLMTDILSKIGGTEYNEATIRDTKSTHARLDVQR